ncbi:hypothetical protein DSD19_07215 [Rhodovulum sp. BSW8]|uniref:nickel/cobalt transporter n=1 Tax=Rhodovulum sp. BSW8 TaxID=2259645 RepID=UPI000DE309F6|nr:hypothetical protein [Rhodovulum sp. BSW8]RBO53893.1 hypothetical protein DSD19_07215 [Rhodovulum sp. BSW8]
MRLILTVLAALALVVAIAVAATGPQAAAAFLWAAEQQRAVQEMMAAALRAIKAGNPMALAGLCLLSGAYGFLHAVGPGHGKLLLGSAALAGGIPIGRMLAVGLAASLAQSAMAILLVSAGAGIWALTSAETSALAEGPLANLSRWAIAAIGALVAVRGARALWRLRTPIPPERSPGPHAMPGPPLHDHADCGCGHAHGPTAAQMAALRSPREVAGLILSIAIRPCTGALFLLAVAFRFGIPVAGGVAVLAMGLGTATFNCLAIGGGVFMRRMTLRAAGAGTVLPGLQLAAGLVIVLLTLGPRF